MGKLTKEQIAINKRRQAYMKAVGYNVPQDGSWGPWQQKIWDKLSTKQKQYDTTLMGFAQGMWDKLTGNDTVKYDPTDSGTVRTWSPDNVDWGKTRRSQNKVVNAVSGTWAPIAAIAGLPALVTAAGASIPTVTASVVGGAAGGAAVDKASEAITGHDIGTNIAMHTPLSPDLGEWINLGYALGGRYGGRYGNFVENNLANRERYTLNYLIPASYKGHGKDLVKTVIAPFYSKPPTFFNGRKPAWYPQYARANGADAAEARFQNGLVWAGIPETEAAHPMYVQNADGSYRTTPEGFGFDTSKMPGLTQADLIPEETTLGETLGETFEGDIPDFFTKGGVGGSHSDYINYGEIPGTNGARLMQFQDEQKLNPQWIVTTPIKKLFPEGSSPYNFFHKLGGIPMDRLFGYKPFKYKQNYIHTGNDVYPIYSDPTTGYTPNFMFAGN